MASAAPFANQPAFIELPVEGFEPALVSLPSGRGPRWPVMVTAHGAGGTARAHCQVWRDIVKGRGFVVCPRGHRMYPPQPPRYFFNGHPALAREVTRDLAALARRYPNRADLDKAVYVGYSQGATMGSMMLPTHSAQFAFAMLVEGGFGETQEWNIAAARRFYHNGARRVALVCGRRVCYRHATTTAGYMRRGGLQTHVAYVSAGHTHAGPVRALLRAGFAWLVQDDPRWH